MRYAEAIDFLYELARVGTTLGLERTFRLAEMAGRPQDRLRFIHVAGTNGKGSTCAMLESIYRAAGYRVGLFTSPHLIAFAERIQVNRQVIPESEVARLVELIRPFLEKFPAQAQPSFFEVVTVMGLIWFAEQQCDPVIWETGLGGRLDATNIVTPVASVITNIQRDHEKWLGHSLAEIAAEKAGIIKHGVPVFTGTDSEMGWQVIATVAAEKRAHIERVLDPERRFKIPLAGDHQLRNAALAVATVRGLQSALPVADAAIQQGLESVRWAGRFDVRGRFILDGAHNPDGAQTLRETLENTFPGKKHTFILGILRDKDVRSICRELAEVAAKVFTVAVQTDRAADAAEIAQEFRSVVPSLDVEACASLAEAIKKSEHAPLTIITGSLHFIGEAMEVLHLEPGSHNERRLNEWGSRSG